MNYIRILHIAVIYVTMKGYFSKISKWLSQCSMVWNEVHIKDI